MHLLDLSICNFRRFERFHCELHPRFTLLVGENGAGKTSVLKALERGVLQTSEISPAQHFSKNSAPKMRTFNTMWMSLMKIGDSGNSP